jgi:hypothetical protein
VWYSVALAATDAAESLYYAWADQMWAGKLDEAKPRPLAEWERSALLHGEKPITKTEG